MGLALAAAGQVMGFVAKGKAAEAQSKSAITSMNYSFQNYEMERQDAFDAAVESITTTRLNAQSLQGGVDTAINENLGSGRTATLLKRSVQGDQSRKVASIQQNYKQKSDEIDHNKEGSLLSTKQYIDNIEVPSVASLLIGIGSSVVGAKNAKDNASASSIAKYGSDLTKGTQGSSGWTPDWSHWDMKGVQ